MIIKFLGTHNSETKNSKLVSFLIDDILAVDAGSLSSELSLDEQKAIKAIFLSHGHYDHVKGIAAIAFNIAQSGSKNNIKVFATSNTLEIVKTHFFDGLIYPDFTKANSYLGRLVLDLQPMELYKPRNMADYHVIAIPVRHTIDSVGYGITSEGKTIFYTGDTGPGLSNVWEHVSPQLIIADTTYPDRLQSLAKDAGHLCPKMLKEELLEFRKRKGYLPKVVLIHMSPSLNLKYAQK